MACNNNNNNNNTAVGLPPNRRKNGFSRPFAKSQISAWIAFVVTFIEFIVFITPVLPLKASIPVTVVFTAVAVGVLYYGILTQLIDPIDVHLEHHLRNNNGNNNNNNSNNDHHTQQQQLPQEEMKQCWICDTQVAVHSMHCKFCNKCIYHFDHHCMWMNTCIGSANYSHFYRTMLLLLIMELSHFVIQIVLLIDSFTGGSTNDRVRNNNTWLGGGDSDTAEIVHHAVWIFFVIFNSISIILLGQLIWFHIGLQRQNLTTYQFIVQDSKKKREQMRLEEDLANQRIVAVAKARRENNRIQVMRLQMGGCCRDVVGCAACDPMDLPEPADPEAGFAAALGNATNMNTNGFQSSPAFSYEENEEAGVGEERPPSSDDEPEGNFSSEQLTNGNGNASS